MEATVSKPTNVKFDAIRVSVPVNYEEEDIPNDFPFRKGDVWDVTIDLETSKIRDWPAGQEPRDIYMKVVDGGSYYLLDGEVEVAKIDQDYVPSCIPGSYGDYLDFKIAADGTLTNFEPDADEIAESFFPDKS